ncbi:YkvA family protein [Brachyspira pilosicoli]|uniref:YkvA family protein n=1 Tax=Brachyspira pilosicoli TaxID=52584 RepID=UPI00300644CD
MIGFKDKANELWINLSKSVDREKLESLLYRTKEILSLSASSDKLYQLKEQIQTLINMIKDYVNGNYKNIPWKAISAISAALLYLLLPTDVIADFLPIVGLLDDAFIIGLCIKLFNDEIEKYKTWKLKSGNNKENIADTLEDK